MHLEFHPQSLGWRISYQPRPGNIISRTLLLDGIGESADTRLLNLNQQLYSVVQMGPKGGNQVLEIELSSHHDSDLEEPKLLSEQKDFAK